MLFRRSEVIYPAVALIILIGITVVSLRDWEEFRRASGETAETRRILETSDDLFTAVTEAESGQRGFLLTGEESYLGPYQKANNNIPTLLATLHRLTGNYHAQLDRVHALDTLIQEKRQEMQTTIEVRRRDGLDAAISLVRTGLGSQAMEQIRKLCGEINSEEYGKLEARQNAMTQYGQRTRWIWTSGSALLVLFLVLSSIALAHAATRREALIDDLTDAKRQTDEIRELLETTLTSIADGVIATDLAGKITFLNPVAERLTGWSAAEAKGLPIDRVCCLRDEATGQARESPAQRVTRDEVVDATISGLISRDGHEFPVEERCSPIRDNQGARIGVVLVVRDIAERRRAEETVRRSNEDLQQFAFAASHDLKTPLRTVTNFSQLLAGRYRGRLDQDADEFIEFIVGATHQMDELLEALLQYCRAGEILERPCWVETGAVLESALTNLRAEIQETGAEITHGPLPTVLADELHLRQVFQNLVGNAIKYHGEAPPRIHVSAERNTTEWVISVSDNGIGIAAHHFDRIFGIFKRLHGSEYPGTGIGLAACRRIVERYGGRIWLTSEPGAGSIFSFSMPINSRQAVRAASKV